MGAREILETAEEYKTVGEVVADCRLVVGTTSVGHRELAHTLRRLEHGAALVRRQMQSAPVALLFGSEKFGLTNDDLSHCHWLLRIATADQEHSMNLGQAVAVCLYELTHTKARAAGVRQRRRATAAENEQITELLLEVLRSSG